MGFCEMSGKNCEQSNKASIADLRGANLSGANLSGRDLSGANLSEADLRWANLIGADLRGANLIEANLYEADLSWANLTGANLRWADLRDASLHKADLTGANLSGVDLREADLTGTIGLAPVTEYAVLLLLDVADRVTADPPETAHVADLICNLSAVAKTLETLLGRNTAACIVCPIPEFTQLFYADRRKMLDFARSVLADRGAAIRKKYGLQQPGQKDLRLTDLRRADLSGRDLRGVDLSSKDLSGANLSVANLTGADLSGADLAEADLSVANLTGVDLSGADLSGADLSGANLAEADLSVADLSHANLSDADLSGAILSGASLRSADLTGTDLAGANLNGADLTGAIGLQQSDRNQVDHPSHYASACPLGRKLLRRLGLCDADLDRECDLVLVDLGWHKNAYLYNAVAYLWRCESKGMLETDLRKARWNLNRLSEIDGPQPDIDVTIEAIEQAIASIC